jgi:hypothetical protein
LLRRKASALGKLAAADHTALNEAIAKILG